MTQEKRFTEYINQHKNLILKITSIYCQNQEERKDLFQEIVLQLWKSFDRYDNTYAFSTWLYRIALNMSISYVRKTSNHKKLIEDYKGSISGQLLEEGGSNENLDKLHDLFKHLKPVEKALISLKLEGCDNAQISKILGISTSNVSTRLNRIINKFKNFKNV